MPAPSYNAYPPTSALQSGDLLFPKTPGDKVWLFQPELQEDWHLSTELAATPDADYVQIILKWLAEVFGQDVLGSLSAAPLGDIVAFASMLRDDLPFKDYNAIEKLGHAFGHVAMAFEDSGNWFVFEAGCTDYSHYRVSIAPYFDADDANRPAGRKRSWAARRQALGQCVWASRRTGLKPNTVPTIVDECKNWLGVPYGILEPGMMTNPDRFYCSELLQKAFQKARLPIDENQTWDWFLQQLNPLLPTIAALLKPSLLPGKSKFPLLSPKMIYTDKHVSSVFEPQDSQGNVLKYL